MPVGLQKPPDYFQNYRRSVHGKLEKNPTLHDATTGLPAK